MRQPWNMTDFFTLTITRLTLFTEEIKLRMEVENSLVILVFLVTKYVDKTFTWSFLTEEVIFYKKGGLIQ